ncbi:MAG: chemotaxis protein CheW [Erythrobacter sp.]
MDDLLIDFIAETRDMMEAIEGEIIAWEANPADSTRLDAIFRFVHTVKGNCGFFDLPRLERLSHAAEDALSDVRAKRRTPDGRFVSTILAIIDCIGEIVDAIEADKPFPNGRELPLIAALAHGEEIESETVVLPQNGDTVTAVAAAPRSIRLPVELLDRVMSGVSDMVLARNDLSHRLQQSGNQPMVDGPFERLTAILNDVRDAITRMRMQRVEQLFSGAPRLVRDLSKELGKQVLLDIEGGDVELDREVIEIIRDPLTHIIRNSLDHGIESPAERIKAGKPANGLLRIAARQTGNRISIVITDDGRGLDAEKIAKKALAKELITQAQRTAMDDNAIHQLVFEPGLTTASEVSNISGRGVGLDVVRDNLERVGGWIEATSSVGDGASIHLHIPLTLSIIGGLTLEVAGQYFAIPQSYVEEIEYGAGDAIDYTRMGDAALVTVRGERTTCLSLADVLGLEAANRPEDQTYISLRLAKGDIIALSVDRINNIGDIVVKPLPPAILDTGCYSGIALLDDGQPILLLDLPQIAADHQITGNKRSRIDRLLQEQDSTSDQAAIKAMLFTDMEGRQKATRLEMLKRIETVDASAIDLTSSPAHAVIDEQILPVIGLTDDKFTGSKIRLLHLTDETSQILYAVQEIDDAAELTDTLAPCDEDPMIEGMALVDGQSVGLLDGHALFQNYGGHKEVRQPVTCSLPDNDWSRSILAPLVKSSGYEVVFGSDEADIAIILDADGQAEEKSRAATVRLRTAPDNAVDDLTLETSIYRYDRSGLLTALRSASPRRKKGGSST